MSITRIEISGYRGFKKRQSIDFAVSQNDQEGSGLTLITGPNNSGKSSILECLRARQGHQNVSFTAGTRNIAIDDVQITYTINVKIEKIKSINKGSSETTKENFDPSFEIFVLPSRRTFNPFFGRNVLNREQYLQNSMLPSQRSSTLTLFEARLFNIIKSPEKFNAILNEALGFECRWTIDQSDQGNYFLKFFNGKHSHSSDGMGEGIVSIFAIVDAIYDSNPGNVVVIDEPELSLHPSLQKRLAALLTKFSKDRQIIVSTHSPYFVDLNALANGGHLARIISGRDGTEIHQLTVKSKKSIFALTKSVNNPHIFGLDAKELFFQEDQIILTEGQETLFFTLALPAN